MKQIIGYEIIKGSKDYVRSKVNAMQQLGWTCVGITEQAGSDWYLQQMELVKSI